MLHLNDMENTAILATMLNHYFSLATLILFLFTISLCGDYAYMRLHKKGYMFVRSVYRKVTDYILPLGFIITFSALLLTLFYSEVLHYAPCDLCWYQRVFLYPLPFLFALAMYKKDMHVLAYVKLLSIFGAVIALYHHLLQMGYDIYTPCSGAPFAASCAKPSFVEFGFVTFPLMSFALFTFLIALILITEYVHHKKQEY